ncbi:hypothetical protein RintRC_6076 [Richelia intracellularis]|nr:hypothetical protein RintRC_6076 [Richelia intracellularis]
MPCELFYDTSHLLKHPLRLDSSRSPYPLWCLLLYTQTTIKDKPVNLYLFL